MAYGKNFCCESPQPQFTVPNGAGQLANDQPAEIALPEGTVSAEGIEAIAQLLLTEYSRLSNTSYYYLAYDLEPVGDQFLGTGGNYAKRLSAHAAKTRQLKLPPSVLEKAGMIAREHSSAPPSSVIEVTRKLNEGPRFFYHTQSCWWGSYSYSRCTLKTNGGFGIRSFNDRGAVTGRAWAMPLKPNFRGGLTPTFDTAAPAAYVVFNGYGQLAGYTAPRLLSAMAGWAYKRIEFGCDRMSVNAGSYLVAPDPGMFRDLYLNPREHASLFDDEQAQRRARLRAEQTEAEHAARVAATCLVCGVKHKTGSAVAAKHAIVA